MIKLVLLCVVGCSIAGCADLEVEDNKSISDRDGDGFSVDDGDCDDNDPQMKPTDADGDGQTPCDGDCDDSDRTVYRGSAEHDSLEDCMQDKDGDGFGNPAPPDQVVAGTDCDDVNAVLGSIETDSDCDGVLTETDCDDSDPETVNDMDCDGVETLNDCDDADPSLVAVSADGDCDGILTGDDCDDGDSSSTAIDEDGDCDGVPASADCDDADASKPADDADCDGALTADDCDDADASLGALSSDGDCDGVLTDADCDDGDASLGATALDLDCDGVIEEGTPCALDDGTAGVYNCSMDCAVDTVGDGVCDADFECVALDDDGGDCTISTESPGEVCINSAGDESFLDCDCNCTLYPYWLGPDDGFCDSHLNCEDLAWDGGDCAVGSGTAGVIECDEGEDDTGDIGDIGEPGICDFDYEDDLGSSYGSSVTTGTTSGASDHTGSCGGGSAADYAIRWVAPSGGTWVITTYGSSYDTVLLVYTDASCTSPSHCNDDGGSDLTSSLSLSLDAGEEILIVVDGYSTSSGSFVLNINPS